MNSNKDNFLNLIQRQTKSENLNHAYMVFGKLDPAPLIETYKINTPDIFIVSQNPIKINHIRELIHWLYIRPHSSSLKLAILSGVDRMTLEAANSLLKILEEPPGYAILILQACRKEKILPTVLSRCQLVRQKHTPDIIAPQNFLQSDKITNLSIKERFDYVAKIIDDEDLVKLINLWEAEIRLKLLAGEDVRDILKSISRTRSLLLTNTSVKLLLENLMLKF